MADNSKAQAQSDGTSLADKPEIILERLGFARPRQQQLVSLPLGLQASHLEAAAGLLLCIAVLLLQVYYCIFATAAWLLHCCYCMLHLCYCRLILLNAFVADMGLLRFLAFATIAAIAAQCLLPSMRQTAYNKLPLQQCYLKYVTMRVNGSVCFQVTSLSGGERRRLQLAAVLVEKPNLLIMDEPTNDLDLQTVEVVEELLSDYKGCLLVVSHDRTFMENLADRLFVVTGDGLVRMFDGLYSEVSCAVAASCNSTDSWRLV